MEEKERLAAIERNLDAYGPNLDPDQVAEILNCTRRYVDKLIDAGKLPAFALDPTKERQEKRVTKADLLAYMLKNQIN